ncbi:MAG: ABC transporter permease, partial [Muribaculaceae bacterium]|nr:ABC transporter permease [Muribaculaceae bacterium]
MSKTSLRIAFRYLFSRKSHSVVNVISAVTVAGVAVAVAAMVVVMSVFNGFNSLIASRLSELDPILKV